MATSFEQLRQLTDAKGIDAGLDYLEQFTRRKQEYSQLFEVLKMRVRQGMGLPILYSQTPDDLSDQQQRVLEDGLLAACREVGTLMFKKGDFVQGWAYLQPVGDKVLNEKLIRSVKVDEENADALIDIAVSQGAAPGYGFKLLLEQFGTCNGITTFDTQAAMFDLEGQRAMAAELLNHLYDQLVENLVAVVKEAGGQVGDPLTLGSILDQNKELSQGSYVIDATHLASVVRISRILHGRDEMTRAFELARYGSYLPDDFQYPGQVPFENTYEDHLKYYGALLGQDVDGAIGHFRKKVKKHDPLQHGSVAIESLVELLVRLERRDEAIDVMTQELLAKHAPMGIAPMPTDVAQTSGQKQKLMEFYQAQDDLLGFGQCLLSDCQ
jgi:plasmid stabilization system protein ParE